MIITSEQAPIFRLDGVTAVGYASPNRGARDVSLWRLSLVPGETSPTHVLSREEVFLALGGSAVATIDGAAHTLGAGDCMIVRAGAPFTLVAGEDGLDAVCAMAAGGQATMLPDGPTITPPWAE